MGGSIQAIKRALTGTIIAAYIPIALKGIMGLNPFARNATQPVKEVTPRATTDFLKECDILFL